MRNGHRMKTLLDSFATLLIPSVVLLHLFWSPYTKVEESFNIQATHDILFAGIPTKNVTAYLNDHYDHVSFPGSVPRTFVGALLLAGLSRPWVALTSSSSHLQLVARGTLGLFNAVALLAFRNAVSTVFGKSAGLWYALFQASQFHVMYYASRTLPNMFAFGFTTLAVRSLLLAQQGPESSSWKQNRLAIYLLTIAGVVFRSEIAILLACHTAGLVWSRKSIPTVLITAGLTGAAIGLLLTVPIDSFFWQRFPLWPEWSGFYYNTILGKSADWGISPWHTYFANALPKLLMNPLTYALCMPVSLTSPSLRQRVMTMIVPHFAFVMVYSILPHKEWRFIVYVVPGMTAVAATGAAWIWDRRDKAMIYRILSIALVGSVLATFTASAASTLISGQNYPGGMALQHLHKLARSETFLTKRNVTVHMDNLACQTGVTRFLENHGERPQWIYDKTEDKAALLAPDFWQRFDFVLAERPEKVIGSWEVIDTIYGFAGIGVVKPGEDLTYTKEPFQKGEDVVTLVEEDGFVLRLWYKFESFARNFTKGYWVRVELKPKIRILKKGDLVRL